MASIRSCIFFVCTALILAFAIKPDAVQKSALAPYVTTATRAVALVMPGSLRAQFHLGFEKFREALIQSDKESGKQ